MKKTPNFLRFCRDLTKGSDLLAKLLSSLAKLNELTLRRLERKIRRSSKKIFKIKKKKKYFKERINVAAVDVATISEKIYAEENKYCFSRPQYFYENNKLEFRSSNYFSPVLLKNVQVIGSSNFVLLNNESAIYELYFFNTEKNFSYIDPSFVAETEGNFTLSYNESGERINAAVNFCGNFSFNYYHFLLEIAAKFYYLKSHSISKDIPIVVDDVVGKTKQFKEIIDYLNTDKRDIFYLGRGYKYNFEELYFLPTLNFLPPEYVDNAKIKYQDCLFHLESVRFLQNALNCKASAETYGKRIFISRNNASARRKYNEEEVVELFRNYGFTICSPEKMSFSEQVSLFSGAEFIAGVTGAAFTNLIFCREGCKALCLMSHALDLSIFSTIAKISGVDLQYYIENEKNIIPDGLHTDFVLDVVKLERVLADFMNDDVPLAARSKEVTE